VRDHDIDRRRIFVTGLSAGGAMTLALLATYPDVFAAGAVIAGLPYGSATNAQEALRAMFQAPTKSSRELGDLVREASPNRNIWPKLSVWHGGADRIVKANERRRDHQAMAGRSRTSVDADVSPNCRRAFSEVWWNADGETVIEILHNHGHGTRHPSHSFRRRRCRALHDRGGYLLIGSHREFFGLTDTLRRTPAETTWSRRRRFSLL